MRSVAHGQDSSLRVEMGALRLMKPFPLPLDLIPHFLISRDTREE